MSGRVTRTDTGMPVEKASVRLSRLDGRAVRSLVATAESGDFNFLNLAAGEYRLTWTGNGLANPDASVTNPFGTGQLIKITDGQRLSNVQLQLSPMPVITGRVVDPAGNPMSDVRVYLSNLRNRADRPQLVLASTKIEITDADGKYRFVDLLPGDYYIRATAGPFQQANPNDSTVVPDKLLPFVPTYFPGTPSALVARPVRVMLGVNATDVTIPLVPSELVPVSGRVSDATGQAVPDAVVLMMLTEAGQVQGELAARVKSDANGRFAYPGIPPGTYMMQVFAKNAFGSRTVGVPAIAEGVSGIGVTVRPPVSAKGRVRFEGGAPPNRENFFVMFTPTDYSSGPIGSNSLMAKPNEDWTFSLSGLAWTGLIRVSPVSGWALKSVMLNGRDIVDVPSDFQTADVTGLELVMTNRLASIVGTVTDGDKPVAAMILVLPEELKNGLAAARPLTAGGSSSEGTFQIPGVLAGRYRLVAFQPPNNFDMEWIKGLYAFATPVTVSENETKTVALKLVRR